ncbi:MAG: hypothetical protein ACI4XL_13345 [Bacillus sp. (in: firmicutes)]
MMEQSAERDDNQYGTNAYVATARGIRPAALVNARLSSFWPDDGL